MPVQVQPHPWDDRLYNQNRDYAHNFPFVAQTIAHRIHTDNWAPVTKLLEDAGIDKYQIGLGMQAFVRMLLQFRNAKHKTLYQAAVESGWMDQSPVVQLAIMSTLGVVLTGCYFTGLREA